MVSTARRSTLGALALLALLPALAAAGPEPAPPYPPRQTQRPVRPPAPPPYRPPYQPAPVVVADPPPLSPVMRVIYAPFYAAGLVVRYGVYYVLVAPIEVFARTIEYGVNGGVPAEPPPPREDRR
jgi:hypothetical protein